MKLFYFYFWMFASQLVSLLYADSLSNAAIIPSPNYLLATPYATEPVIPTPFSCYNSKDNKYFVSWHNSVPYEAQLYINYAIYNADGTVNVPTQLIFINETTPNSDVICCYNSLQDRYFLSWSDANDGIKYGFLDNQGNPIGSLYTIHENAAFDVFCTFNSLNNQYFLTWVGSDLRGHFAIVNEDGSLALTEANIENYTGTTVNSIGSNIYSCYNPDLNQYFLAWLASDNNVYFSIYNAIGTLIQPPTALTTESSATGYYVSISYNLRDKNYILTWVDNAAGNYSAIFAVCNQNGTIAIPPTSLISSATRSTSIYNTYCIQNNQILLSMISDDLDLGTTIVTVILCDASGNILTPTHPLAVPVFTQWAPYGSVFSSYSSVSDTFFISWMISENSANTGMGVYSIYFATPLTPPPSLKGKRLFNRFANYGEYYNVLNWTPSTAPNITSYNIYRNDQLIKTVPSSQTSFQEHRQPNKLTTYTITSVNSNNDESLPISTTF